MIETTTSDIVNVSTQAGQTLTDALNNIAVGPGGGGGLDPADRAKLDGIEPGATANSPDAQLRDRSTHTGTQTASTVGFQQEGAGAVATTVQAKLREFVSVTDFGAVGDGVVDDTAAIQAAINSVRDGVVLIPGGEYRVNSDLVLLNKGSAPEEGAFRLEATGAFFVGTGRVVIDSSKRVQISGLDMANMDMVFRGCWWSQFSNMRFKRLHINDAAGSGFSSNYWNRFQQCQLQTVLTDAASTQPSNEFTFESCCMRGNAGQGFSGTAAYAFEFNAAQNVQSWKFNNGDISYHTTAIYNVGAGNTSNDIELMFNGVYFDSILPLATSRNNTSIREINCHHANGLVGFGSISAMTCKTLDQFRNDRSFKMDAWSGINLIPNGDFRDRLNVWVGADLPVGDAAGATITRINGGFFGNALNINQPSTSGNAVYLRSKVLPYAGRLTGVMILRNANVGNKTMMIGFPGPRYSSVTLSDTEWTVVTLTNNTLLGGTGTRQDILVYTNDGTSFNVNVAYVALTYGNGSPLALNSSPYPVINHVETWDAPSLATGTQITQTFTVNGVEQGDFVLASFGGDIGALDVTANASATNHVTLKLRNDSGSTIDLPSGQWRFRAFKRAYA